MSRPEHPGTLRGAPSNLAHLVGGGPARGRTSGTRETGETSVGGHRIQPGMIYIGRYQIQELLGRGGMGEVWGALDLELGREVAIKVLQARFAQQPAFLRRFRREMKAAAQLNHPNIVQLHDAGQDPDGRLYMVMERARGITLREEIDTCRRLDLVTGVYSSIQTAEALGTAHAVGIWHRDVKPENAIIHEDGRLWLLDFGIALVKDRHRSTGQRREGSNALAPQASQLMGTLLYMAPELFLDQEADHRADLYSLGVVLFESLTGQSPFGRGMTTASETEIQAAHIYQKPLSMVKLVPELPESIERVTLRLLAKNPDERYADVDELLPDLRQVFRESAPPDHPIAKRQIQDRTEQGRKRAFARRRQESQMDAAMTEPPTTPRSERPTSGKGDTEPMGIRRKFAGTAPLGPTPSTSESEVAKAERATPILPPGFLPPSARVPWVAPLEPEARVTQELPIGYFAEERAPFPLAPPPRRHEAMSPTSARPVPSPSPAPAPAPARREGRALVVAVLILAGAMLSMAVVLLIAIRSLPSHEASSPAPQASALPVDPPSAAPPASTPPSEPEAPSATAAPSAEAPVVSASARPIPKPSPKAKQQAPKPSPKPLFNIIESHEIEIFRRGGADEAAPTDRPERRF